MDKPVEDILCDVIQTEMGLPDGHIFVQNQNYTPPNDNALYIVVGFADSHLISNINRSETSNDGTFTEKQEIVAQENFKIDIMSSSAEAMTRRWEILQALASIYAQQQQEKYQFRIFSIPKFFINTSRAEGGSVISRFTIIIPCHCHYEKEIVKTNPYDYYDDFKLEVFDEKYPDIDTPIIEIETK